MITLLVVLNVVVGLALLTFSVRRGTEDHTAGRRLLALGRHRKWGCSHDAYEYRVTGEIDGIGVHANIGTPLRGDTRLKVAVQRGIDGGFTSADPFHKPNASPQEMPDHELKRRFDVQATPEFVLMRVQGEARRLLVQLLEGGWTLTGGPTLRATHASMPTDLDADLRRLVAVAAALSSASRPHAALQLEARLQSEPRPRIRVAVLQMLLTDHPDHAATSSAIQSTRGATGEPVQLEALRAVRERRLPLTPSELAVLLGSPEESDRVDAILRLGAATEFPEAALVTCLRQATQDETRVAAAELLARRCSRAGLPALQRAPSAVGVGRATRPLLEHAYEQAVARLGLDRGGGGLAVVPDDGGALSLHASADRGALSKVTS